MLEPSKCHDTSHLSITKSRNHQLHSKASRPVRFFFGRLSSAADRSSKRTRTGLEAPKCSHGMVKNELFKSRADPDL